MMTVDRKSRPPIYQRRCLIGCGLRAADRGLRSGIKVLDEIYLAFSFFAAVPVIT